MTEEMVSFLTSSLELGITWQTRNKQGLPAVVKTFPAQNTCETPSQTCLTRQNSISDHF